MINFFLLNCQIAFSFIVTSNPWSVTLFSNNILFIIIFHLCAKRIFVQKCLCPYLTRPHLILYRKATKYDFKLTDTYLFLSHFHRYVAKQLPGIGLTFSSALVNAGITSVDKLTGTDPREIEMICSKRPPFGNNLRDAAKLIPNYVMQVNQVWVCCNNLLYNLLLSSCFWRLFKNVFEKILA